MSNAHTEPMNYWELEDHILDMMGEAGTVDAALVVAGWCWDDGARTIAELARRWVDDDSFFMEWHKAEAEAEEAKA